MVLRKFNQKGTTMIEMLGVLTIIIILGISSIKLIGNVYSLFKQGRVASEIRDLQKNISERYRFEGHYEDMLKNKTPEQTAAFLCDNKLAPIHMCYKGKIYNEMSGEVWILPVSDGSNVVYDKYAVSFANLSKKACLNAAQINWNTQNKVAVYKMIINSGTAKQVVVDVAHNVQSGSSAFPIKIEDAMKGCSNEYNTIQWVFF